MVRFAKCCNPVPGDEVVGFITRGRGISVHRKDCSNFKTIMTEEPEKIVEVNWGVAKGAYTAEIQVRSEDRDGLLADIMTVITESKLPLNGLNANSTKTNTALVNIKVKIDNVEQLKELMRKIRKLKGVLDVYRMNS
jgi:GTP pyrophosphokinase